jgi:hypothetical protein
MDASIAGAEVSHQFQTLRRLWKTPSGTEKILEQNGSEQAGGKEERQMVMIPQNSPSSQGRAWDNSKGLAAEGNN